MKNRRAALIDRDGTIIEDRDYTNNPADVILLPGAAEAIKCLAANGLPSIAITNQSGIARGLVTYSQYRAVRTKLNELLAAEETGLLDTFACPHHPDFDGPCDCRKPALAMYQRAGAVHDLDLSTCVFIGDRTRDVEPALEFNATGILIRSGHTSEADQAFALRAGIAIVGSLAEAATMFAETGC